MIYDTQNDKDENIELGENKRHIINYIGLILVLVHIYSGNMANHNILTRITSVLQIIIAIPLFWYPYIIFYKSLSRDQLFTEIFNPDIANRFVSFLLVLAYLFINLDRNSGILTEIAKVMQTVFYFNLYSHILSYKIKHQKENTKIKQDKKIKKISLIYKRKVIKVFNLSKK